MAITLQFNTSVISNDGHITSAFIYIIHYFSVDGHNTDGLSSGIVKVRVTKLTVSAMMVQQ